jgi:dTDP-4-dehydrorhamnose reductase
MAQPVLIVGASGQVGAFLLTAAREAGLDAVGTYCTHALSGLEKLDLTDTGATAEMIGQVRPSAVYIPASRANVDLCEREPGPAYQTNVTGICNAVRAANAHDALVVYFSSDYIFNGHKGPYSEGDSPSPICEYGRQKVYAEHIVATQARRYLIIRTTVVYGWESQGKNFIYRLEKTLSAGQPLRAPHDQVGSPTYAPELAAGVLRLVEAGAHGVFHVVGSRRASRYDFAVEAARVFGLPAELIVPVSTPELRQDAPRPLDAGMRIDKFERVAGRTMMGYPEGLRAMLADRKPV